MLAGPRSVPRSAPTSAQQRALLLLIWASAYSTYLLAYSSAVHLAGIPNIRSAFLIGLANSLPEALAAPVVLGLASASRERGFRGFRLWIALPILAVAFTLWCILGATAGLAIYQFFGEGGKLKFSLDSRNLAWKALLSLLVFALLAGVGMARAYAREARAASARAERAETLRAEARLAVLRAQLNPHFILNVLHSLVGLAERDPGLTASTLERLGTTLRYALRVQSRGIDRVALREELAFVHDYVALERLRLGDRLTIRFKVDDSLLDRVVPSFVLQPLVENAIRHGIAPQARGGSVEVTISEDSGDLVLTVDDDGPPTADAPAAEPEPGGSGVGLRLLRDRIETLYGPLYGQTASLVTGRSPMGGFRARVRLPAEPFGEAELAS